MSFYTIPDTGDSCWIVSSEELSDFLMYAKCYFEFESKIQSMYQEASFKGNTVFLPDHMFFIYTKGLYRHRKGFPTRDIKRLVDSIVSIALVKQDSHDSCSIWNVCNVLSIKGGYMRVLFDQIKWYYEYFRVLTLHVAFSNPFFERAISLYLCKGFIYDTEPIHYKDIAVTMYCILPDQTTYSKEITEDKKKEMLKEIHRCQPGHL
jgi:hypothetical protein